MQDKLQGVESAPAVTERRACPRLRVTSLMYIDIGGVNGGIVTSLSENGLALTAAASLANAAFRDGPFRMRIQFPGNPEALEASGEIVWTCLSGKEASVRFVEVGDKSREQIRDWISDQASNSGLRQEPPKLPEMRLSSLRRAKPRRPRFSFAEVASSRVDAGGETGVEDFPGSAAEPGNLPPLQAGAVGFRNGAEAVASAFESPSLKETQTGEIRFARNEQTDRTASDQDLQRQLLPLIPERRQLPRRQVLLFTYAVLGEDNGGLVFNLGEGGLALTSAAALQEHHFAKMRVRFPDSSDWFETSGRLVWKNDSGKEAGIELLNLPEAARVRIKEWVLQGDSAGDAVSKEEGVRTSQSEVQELPAFMEPEPSAEPFEIPASFQEQQFESQSFEEHRLEGQTKTSAPSPSALFKTGIEGISEGASARRRVDKINPPPLPDSVRAHTSVASKALSIAAGVALAVGGWMFFERTSLKEARGLIAWNLPNIKRTHEIPQAREIPKADVGATEATPVPPFRQGGDASRSPASQSSVAKHSVEQIERGSPVPSDAPKTAVTNSNSLTDRTSKEKRQSEESLAQAHAASSPPRSVDQLRPPSPSQRGQEPKSSQIIASAPAPSSESRSIESKARENQPAESKPVLTAQSLPAQSKDLNVTPPSVSANAPQPTAPPPVEMEKEKTLATPKQPEASLARPPVVTVTFDPFPSIRLPKAEKSKKSHQGKNLEMGRLLSRVDPVYPEEAKQQGLEGTARVHAIFNRKGAVQSVISVSGPPLLVSAAIDAVRQWRYSQTILGGQAMETEQDVTVLFRLANSASKN